MGEYEICNCVKKYFNCGGSFMEQLNITATKDNDKVYKILGDLINADKEFQIMITVPSAKNDSKSDKVQQTQEKEEVIRDFNVIGLKLAKKYEKSEHLTEEECKKFDETVGLVEASIGRMVPVQTEEMKDGEPMRVCVEQYGFLPVDKAAFKGEIPDIKNLVPYAPFDFYIKRKLYVHNMGHATCAYLGDLLGLEYIYQAIDVADIRILVQNAMLESAGVQFSTVEFTDEGLLLK